MNKKINLMSHLVAGFPTDEIAFEAAKALVDAGAEVLEIQLPFSDPSADGVAIQSACTTVLSHNYTTKNGLAFVEKIHKAFPNVKIFIMSYGSLIFTPGVENFCKMACSVGVNGLIVPDFPFDCDEGLTSCCKKYGMLNIPVAAPSMKNERLEKLLNANFEYIYVALRAGITGSETLISEETIDFLKKVSAKGAKIYGGFGLNKGEQAKKIAPFVHGVVAGSVFVRLIEKNKNDKVALYNAVKTKAEEFINANL